MAPIRQCLPFISDACSYRFQKALTMTPIEKLALVQYAALAKWTYKGLNYDGSEHSETEHQEWAYQKINDVLDCNRISFFDRLGSQGYIATTHQGRFIAFRGTELSSARDIWRDIIACKVKGEEGAKIHKGFRRAVLVLWDDLNRQIKNARTPVYLTGHSQGAAMALIAAHMLLARGYDVRRVVTFGCPKTGDARFRDFLSARTLVNRIESRMDIIPKLLLGKPVGVLHYLDDAGRIVDSPPWWHYYASHLNLGCKALRNLRFFRQQIIDDHAMTSYEWFLRHAKYRLR